ncbi:MAG: Uma2 family endonuclease [Chloroflexi bacterium]|nr:Uma2 family endonuclease [Chloroflexota bacterium]
MATARIKFTYQDYLQLPEGERKELIEGEFYMTPSPSLWHQDVVIDLGSAMRRYVNARQLGRVTVAPFDVIFDEENVVQPDILFVSNERMAGLEKGRMHGAPDLVVEILSPSTADRDLTYKLKLYARHDVREYWTVDPESRTVRVLALNPRGVDSETIRTSGTVASRILEGFEIPLDDIFTF